MKSSSQIFWYSCLGVFAFALIAGVFTKPFLTLLVLAFCVAVWLLSHYLEFGVLMLVGLAPMIGWQISLNRLRPFLEEYSWIANINASAADFWGVFLLIAFGIFFIRSWLEGSIPRLKLPGFLWYGLFLLTAVVSLTKLPSGEFFAGIKYLFRFVLFAYVVYILPAANILNRKALWERCLYVLFSVGVFAALMGAVSLMRGAWMEWGFVRAVPFDIFGWAPFGYQHILLAEVLTGALPIGVYLVHRETHKRKRQWLLAATALILIVDLLTLSRAAWLTLSVAAVVFVFVTYKKYDLMTAARYVKWALVPLAALIIYTGIFFVIHPSVSSSTHARAMMSDISWDLFVRSPVIGHGVGSFVNRLGDVELFRLEFGDPLDAHGVVQKIAVEQGALGLVTFFGFLFFIFRSLLQRASEMRHHEASYDILLVLFLFGMVWFFQLFNTQYYASTVWIPTMLALVQLKNLKREGESFV